MRMTNAEMCDAIMVMSMLEEKGALGLAIAKNLRKMRDEAKEYLEMRRKVIEQYGDADEKGFVQLSKEDVKRVTEELADVSPLASNVDVCKVSEEVFTGGTLTSKQMENLLWMVEN